MAVRNVRARILVTRNIPGLPEHEAPMTIWWLGKRFHVRERSGRSFRDVAADVAEPRGLGALPRTAEDFIGAHRFFEGNVEVFGATGEESASVREPWGRTWRCPLDRVSPIAAQILAADLGGYTRGRATRFLDRDCVEYNTVREGSEDGRGFRQDSGWR